MAVTLRVEAGPQKGETAQVLPGGVLEVGRLSAGFAVSQDPAMSSSHFRIDWDSRGQARVSDMHSSNGTFLNGMRIQSAPLNDGDRISAGQTSFVVSMRPVAESLAAGPVRACFQEVPGDPLTVLRARQEPLYAVLDAARDARILELLRDSDDRHECLYEAKLAEELADYAPYLVLFSRDSDLLTDLVGEGWGKSWGIYFTSAAEERVLRKHLRRLLYVSLNERRLYFRFYDPRVLRAYVATCKSQQAVDFHGPVTAFLTEPEALRQSPGVFVTVCPAADRRIQPAVTTGPVVIGAVQLAELSRRRAQSSDARSVLEMEAAWRMWSPRWSAGFTADYSEGERREIWNQMAEWGRAAGIAEKEELHAAAMLVMRAMHSEIADEEIAAALESIEEARDDRAAAIDWVELSLFDPSRVR
jgi:hypothetical protein